MSSRRAWMVLADILWSKRTGEIKRAARERVDMERLSCWAGEFGVFEADADLSIVKADAFLEALHSHLELANTDLGYCCILLGHYCGSSCSRAVSQFTANEPDFEMLSFAVLLAELEAEEGVLLMTKAFTASPSAFHQHGWSNTERLETLERIYAFLLQKQWDGSEGLRGLLGIVLAAIEVS